MPGTLYIIGAGASYNETKNQKFPYPLAGDFFNKKLLDEFWPRYTANNTPQFSESSLNKILKHYFNKSITTKDLSINVEEVFSFIDSAPNLFSSRIYNRELFYTAKRELLNYIVNLLSLNQSNISGLPFYSYISNVLSENDSVITFNWDCLLESELEKTKQGEKLILARNNTMVPYGYAPSKRDYDEIALERLHGPNFIKLHGSVDYASCIEPSCIHHAYPFKLNFFDTGCDGGSCPSCGSATEIFIVPPHIHKSYESRRYISLLARIAAAKLSTASKIVVVGYSFPTFDFFANMMFRLSRMETFECESSEQPYLREVTIVDPLSSDRNWLENVKNIIGTDNSEICFGHKVKLKNYMSIEMFMKHNKTPNNQLK